MTRLRQRNIYDFLLDFARKSGEVVYVGMLLAKMREFGINEMFDSTENDEWTVLGVERRLSRSADELRALVRELDDRRAMRALVHTQQFETTHEGDASVEWRRVCELRRELALGLDRTET